MLLDYNKAFYEANLGMQARGEKKAWSAIHKKKKTCANKCVIWNPSLLNTWHVKTVSII
jgi:hypothetical protein